MVHYGQTREILEANNHKVNDSEAKLTAQAKETGEAQAARIRRDNAVDELDEYCSNFIAIARIALEEYPQYFDILNVDFNATNEYGKIRASLEIKGTPIGPLDTLLGCIKGR